VTFAEEFDQAMGNQRQVDVAAQLGVTQSVVSRWSRGLHVPHPDVRPQVADFMGMSVPALDALTPVRICITQQWI